MKKVLIALLIFFGVERFCHWQTAGFRPYKIAFCEQNHKEPCPEDVSKILNQSFHFLGAGKQFYAFESHDGTVVLKFLKGRRKSAPNVRQSAALAYALLKDEASLVYQSHHHFSKPALLYDKLGIEHTIDLNQCEFFIQRKASPFHVTPTTIDALLAMVFSQCQKGIANCDPMIERNFGIVDGKAVLVDFGSLQKKSHLKTPQGIWSELFLELLPLRELIQEKHPHLLHYFDEEFKAYIYNRKV
jgi:hypothetical protein